jgi:hypothetical protein
MVAKKSIVKDPPKVKVRNDIICVRCQFQLSFKQSKFQNKKLLELVNSYVLGPIRQASVNGLKYMVTFIDDF